MDTETEMQIKVNLDLLLVMKKMSLTELSEREPDQQIRSGTSFAPDGYIATSIGSFLLLRLSHDCSSRRSLSLSAATVLTLKLAARMDS